MIYHWKLSKNETKDQIKINEFYSLKNNTQLCLINRKCINMTYSATIFCRSNNLVHGLLDELNGGD
jgi:hypothetical protein